MTKNYVVTVKVRTRSGEVPVVTKTWGGAHVATRDGDLARVTWTVRKHKVKKRSRSLADQAQASEA